MCQTLELVNFEEYLIHRIQMLAIAVNEYLFHHTKKAMGF